jgi:hypothetical protein
MKLFKLITVIIFLGCACRNLNEKKQVPELDSIPDPLVASVHDSLKHLIPVLDSVLKSDQKYRWGLNLQTAEVQEKMRYEMKVHADEIKKKDEKNAKIITAILDKYGFLGLKDIGMKGNLAITMTIQHADIETQEKYLPMFYEAAKKKKMMPSSFAMLADRVAVRKNRQQIYGTQINVANNKNEILPLWNPDSVDVRRKAIGMEPFQNYLKNWKIEWKPSEYKKQLPELIRKYKITDTISVPQYLSE